MKKIIVIIVVVSLIVLENFLALSGKDFWIALVISGLMFWVGVDTWIFKKVYRGRDKRTVRMLLFIVLSAGLAIAFLCYLDISNNKIPYVFMSANAIGVGSLGSIVTYYITRK